MKLIYDINDRPSLGKTIVFAFQQMIAIMAATLLVPMIMTGYTNGAIKFDPAAALCGAGIGTLIYLFFTKRRSPVFLGSSFTFLGAYEAVLHANYGFWGVIIGIAFAGLVYVVLALIIKATGSGWVNKLMPAVIIGPIVALIGLSLSGTATGWMSSNGGSDYSLIYILVGACTFLAIVFASIKGTRGMKLIPFIIGIGAGYVLALILTLIGRATDTAVLKIIDLDTLAATFSPFKFTSILDYPKFTFLKAFQTELVEATEIAEGTYGAIKLSGSDIANIALTFIPIGVVELAQHMADHKNLSNIVNRDLITDPGLDKTLLGDGVGSIVGGIFGGAANTTYGESIGCVLLSFFTPFVAFINSIPKCVMGGACIAMYGFIAVSGLQMLKNVDLGNSKNLFVVAAILVCGIGGLTLSFGHNDITGGALLAISALATAMIMGIITNLLVNNGKMSSGEDNMVSGHAENMGKVKE